MGYYCPFCGEKAYRGHREYKCGNEDCDEFEEPIFGRNRRLNRERYVSTADAPTPN